MVEEDTKSKQETVAQLKAQLAELEGELQAQKTELDKLKERNAGWLVTVNNPMYDGRTFEIQFRNGCAFVRKDTVLPRFVNQVPPKNILDQYSPEEREAIIKSCSMPSAERCVKVLENDFGYKVEYFDENQVDELDRRLAARAQERTAAEAKHEPYQEYLDKLIRAQTLW